MAVHRLKQERQIRGWSQAHLADMLGVSTRTVSRWERGQTFPYPIYREKLCTIFDKDASELDLLPPQEASTTEPTPPIDKQHLASSTFKDPLLALQDPMAFAAVGRTPRLFGRDALLTTVKQRLQVGDHPQRIALYGLPGVGKTAVAATLVLDQGLQSSFHDGILWASVGPSPDVFSLLGRWITLLGAAPPADKQALKIQQWCQVLRSVIGTRHMLIVLDDVWQEEVAMTMQVGGPNCAYILTTRLPKVAFSFAQQEMFPIPELAEEDSMAFLHQSIPDLLSQETAQVHDLVQTIGGLPLALKLVAHVISVQAFTGQPRRVQAALTRLREAQERMRISAPVARGGSSFEASATLQATIAISVQRLDEQSRRALYDLAIFPAKPYSFSEEVALAVGRIPFEALDELWDAGLLESHGPGRYHMHQSIVDFARVQGISLETVQRLVLFTTHYILEHAQEHELLEQELPIILASLDSAIEKGLQRELIEMIDLLAPFLARRARYLLADRYLQAAYQAALALQDQQSQMRMLLHLATFAQHSGDYQQAEQTAQRGLEFARQSAQPGEESAFFVVLGLVAFNRGNLGQAILLYEQGLALARQVHDSKRMCTVLGFLAAVTSMQGRYEQSASLAREGLSIARQLDDKENMVQLLASLTKVLTLQNEYAEAEELLLEALALSDQIGYQALRPRLLSTLADIANVHGEYARAETYLLQCVQLAHQSGNDTGIGFSLATLSDCMLMKQDYTQAEHYIQQGFEFLRQSENRVFLPFLLGNQGQLLSHKGDYAGASACLEQATGMMRQRRSPTILSKMLNTWGDIHLRFRHLEEAAANYNEVRALDADRQKVAEALYGLAQVEALRDHPYEAHHLGRQSFAILNALQHVKAIEVQAWLQTLDL